MNLTEPGERIIFMEEGQLGRLIKVIAVGELDWFLLEALKDFLRHHCLRLTESGEERSEQQKQPTTTGLD